MAAAFTVAVVLLETTPARARNLAVLLPAVTTTEAGVVNNALSSETDTVVPPAGAASLRVTIQLATAPDLRVAGPQANPS